MNLANKGFPVSTMYTSSLQLISEIGTCLAQKTRPGKRKKFDDVIEFLQKAANALSELEQQSPELETAKERKNALKPLIDAMVYRGLLCDEDKDVKPLVAICVTELFRVMAPRSPFEDKHLRDVFKLIIGLIADLADTANPLFSKRVKALNIAAQLNCRDLIPKIDCTDLVLKMFNAFFSVVRDDHDDNLIKDMSSMMRNVLNSNSKDASQKLLEVILQNLIKRKKGATCASYELAKSVIKTCAEVDDQLNSLVCEFISSCIHDRDAVDCWLKEYYHEIIFEIFQCAPHMLLPITGSLIVELWRSNQVDVQLKAVKLVGKVFAILEQHAAQKFHDLFVEFLKTFYHKSVHVRIGALQCAKAVYAVNPFGSESHEIITSVEDRLFDPDAQVRMHAVGVACDIFSLNLKLVPNKLMALMAEAINRLHDTEISVRKGALLKLVEVYQDYCKKCCEGSMAISDHFEEIQCKILVLCRHMECEELRPKSMELILADHLFPDHLSVMERTKHWIHMFSLFRVPHIKALINVLFHKRRLQDDMKNYLAIRKRSKDICAEETQKEIESMFTKMATYFVYSHAKECLHELNRIKDNNLFKSLERLLEEPTFTNGQTIKAELLEMVGDKNPNYGFMHELFSRCSSNIFSSEHDQYILDYCSSDEDRLKDSSKKLLAIIRIPFSVLKAFEIPSMPEGSETQAPQMTS